MHHLGHPFYRSRQRKSSIWDNSYSVVDRASFRNLLREYRLAAKTRGSEDVARWLGQKLNANVVLIEEIPAIGENSLDLSMQLLEVEDRKHKGLDLNDTIHIDL